MNFAEVSSHLETAWTNAPDHRAADISPKDAGPAGELVSADGGSMVIIHGREVISERECTRDAEWKLLHVTLQRSSSHIQASALP